MCTQWRPEHGNVTWSSGLLMLRWGHTGDAGSRKRFVPLIMFPHLKPPFFLLNQIYIKIQVNVLAAKWHRTSVTSREHLNRISCLKMQLSAHIVHSLSVCWGGGGGWGGRASPRGLELLEPLQWPLFARQSLLNPGWLVEVSVAVTEALAGTRHTLQSAGSSLFMMMTDRHPQEANTCWALCYKHIYQAACAHLMMGLTLCRFTVETLLCLVLFCQIIKLQDSPACFSSCKIRPSSSRPSLYSVFITVSCQFHNDRTIRCQSQSCSVRVRGIMVIWAGLSALWQMKLDFVVLD